MRKKLICSALVCTAIISLEARTALAVGEFRLDSSSFFRLANNRTSQSAVVSLRGDLEAQGSLLAAKADLKFLTFAESPGFYTFESRDLHVATSPRLLQKHQVSLGRRHYDWSMIDQEWDLGYLTPRFVWDPLKPEQIGMTGLFYTWEHRAWRVLGFVSPIGIPERGYPIAESNGGLSSASPFFSPPIAQVDIMNDVSVPMRYKIAYPPMSELIFNPGAAISVRYQPESGFGGAVTAASLPMHQADMAMSTKLNPHSALDTTLKPRVLHRHLAIAEAAYQNNDVRFYATTSYELPQSISESENWVTHAYGPTILSSVGGELYRTSRIRLGWSYLSIREKKIDPVEASLLPKRFWFSQAARGNLRWIPNPKLSTEAKWTHDLEFAEDLFSLDVLINPSSKSMDQRLAGWTIGFGMDLISTQTGTGAIGQLEGDDRVRGRISYAF